EPYPKPDQGASHPPGASRCLEQSGQRRGRCVEGLESGVQDRVRARGLVGGDRHWDVGREPDLVDPALLWRQPFRNGQAEAAVASGSLWAPCSHRIGPEAMNWLAIRLAAVT